MVPPAGSAADAVVVPAVTPPSTLACLRSLSRRGIRTIAVSEHETAPAFESKFCDEAYVVPDPATHFAAYADVLFTLATRADVRTILPIREYDVLALASRRCEFGEHVGTPWPDAETLRRVQDRIQLYEIAETAGVAVPETELLSACADWDREQIVKARYSVPPELIGEVEVSHPDRIPGTIYLEPGREPPKDRIRFSMGHDPIVQAYMPDTAEYGFFAVYDRGEALATFQHRQRRGYKYCGGPSAYRESIDDPDLEAAGLRILDELEWHGVAMVEFKRDPETGQFLLMEINPRFWSSLPFTVQAGADFPYYAWQLATGRQGQVADGYEVGVAGHLLRGELLYLHSVFTEEYPLVEKPSRLSAMLDVAGSIVRHPRFDYLSIDDPGPFVRDLRNFVRDLLHPGRAHFSTLPRAGSAADVDATGNVDRDHGGVGNGQVAAESQVEERTL